jgi:hypothetical protein
VESDPSPVRRGLLLAAHLDTSMKPGLFLEAFYSCGFDVNLTGNPGCAQTHGEARCSLSTFPAPSSLTKPGRRPTRARGTEFALSDSVHEVFPSGRREIPCHSLDTWDIIR